MQAHTNHQHACEMLTSQCRQLLGYLGEVLDCPAREDEGNVGAQTEQRIELLGLIHSCDLARAGAVSAGSS